jgi:hypothetical protein
MADLIAFLSHRRGRYIDRSKFPDAVLNGMALDLFGLYKEVVTRGGFRCVLTRLCLWCLAFRECCGVLGGVNVGMTRSEA